jgi:hypothetical protein
VGKAFIYPEKDAHNHQKVFVFFSWSDLSPFFICIAPCTWRVVKAYLECVYTITVLLVASYKVHVSTMSSTF